MRGILIDPVTMTVEWAEAPEGARDDVRALYDLLQCRMIEVVAINNHEAVFVDENGLLKQGAMSFFTIPSFPQPIAGRGIILGLTPMGRLRSTRLDVDDIRPAIGFPAIDFAGFETVVDDPNVIVTKANFRPKRFDA